jgi:hypothetical protein
MRSKAVWREGTAVKVREDEWLWQSYVSKFPTCPKHLEYDKAFESLQCT